MYIQIVHMISSTHKYPIDTLSVNVHSDMFQNNFIAGPKSCAYHCVSAYCILIMIPHDHRVHIKIITSKQFPPFSAESRLLGMRVIMLLCLICDTNSQLRFHRRQVALVSVVVVEVVTLVLVLLLVMEVVVWVLMVLVKVVVEVYVLVVS